MKHTLRAGRARAIVGATVIVRAVTIVIAIALTLSSCATGAPKIIEEKKVGGDIVRVKFESKAIGSGKLERFPNGNVYVSLPASYATSPNRRYPVIYALHGFGDPAIQMIDPFRSALDAAGSSVPEAIIVAVDGTNALGGSFYANSPATGNWEDLVAVEAVALIDRHYRTIPERSARMLSGFSMGGFGAWNIALARADVFCSAWVCCPGAWDDTGLADGLDSWGTGTYTIAYGAAYSPDMKLPKPKGRSPVLDGSESDAKIVADWQRGFGNAREKAASYARGSARLKAVSFAYGTNDAYPWIPRGTVFVAEAMKEAGIPVSIASFETGHGISTEMIETTFLPAVTAAFGK